MTAAEIVDAFEAGNPGTERLARLRARVEALSADGAWGTLLSSLCGLDGTAAWTFLRGVQPDPVPGASPRGLDGILSLVERLRDGSLRCRVALQDIPYESMPMPELHRATVRRRLGLQFDAWSEAAEAESRRLHDARDRPFVLMPAGDGDESGPQHIVAALAANAARAEALRLRSEEVRVRREAVLAARAG